MWNRVEEATPGGSPERGHRRTTTFPGIHHELLDEEPTLGVAHVYNGMTMAHSMLDEQLGHFPGALNQAGARLLALP